IFSSETYSTNGSSWSAPIAAVYGTGATGVTSFHAGVYGYLTGSGNNSAGVLGAYSSTTWGGLGYIDGTGTTYGGYFSGSTRSTGTVFGASKSFKIDHPLDPTHKYLIHSCVESPDMLNIYNGNITTDAKGNAEITLPDYFQAENIDYKYQLTV